MRVLVQRVSRARVTVAGETIGEIGRGLLLLVGIGQGDGTREVQWMAEKIAGLRVFPDADGRMNRSLIEVAGEALVVSQFTLYGDCRRGKRPSFTGAAVPEEGEPRIRELITALAEHGVGRIAEGHFGAMMDVELVNEGPVTLWLAREPAE